MKQIVVKIKTSSDYCGDCIFIDVSTKYIVCLPFHKILERDKHSEIKRCDECLKAEVSDV